jgi:hypothetical protein
VNAEHVEAEEQVSTEATLLDLDPEAAVRRGNHPRIQDPRLRATYAFVLPILEDPEKTSLQAEIELADLVEKNGSIGGELEAARSGAHRARERAALVTEELTLDE